MQKQQTLELLVLQRILRQQLLINREKTLHNLLPDGLLGMEDTDERISSNHKYLFGTDKNSSTYSSKAKSSFSSGNTLSSLTASGETARKP